MFKSCRTNRAIFHKFPSKHFSLWSCLSCQHVRSCIPINRVSRIVLKPIRILTRLWPHLMRRPNWVRRGHQLSINMDCMTRLSSSSLCSLSMPNKPRKERNKELQSEHLMQTKDLQNYIPCSNQLLILDIILESTRGQVGSKSLFKCNLCSMLKILAFYKNRVFDITISYMMVSQHTTSVMPPFLGLGLGSKSLRQLRLWEFDFFAWSNKGSWCQKIDPNLRR